MDGRVGTVDFDWDSCPDCSHLKNDECELGGSLWDWLRVELDTETVECGAFLPIEVPEERIDTIFFEEDKP